MSCISKQHIATIKELIDNCSSGNTHGPVLTRQWGATLVQMKVKGEGKVVSLLVYIASFTPRHNPPPPSPILLSFLSVVFVHPRIDVTSQLFSPKRGGASDPKNPDLFDCTLLFLMKADLTFPSARPMIKGPCDGQARHVTADV